jgi:hypothetical protein
VEGLGLGFLDGEGATVGAGAVRTGLLGLSRAARGTGGKADGEVDISTERRGAWPLCLPKDSHSSDAPRFKENGKAAKL